MIENTGRIDNLISCRYAAPTVPAGVTSFSSVSALQFNRMAPILVS